MSEREDLTLVDWQKVLVCTWGASRFAVLDSGQPKDCEDGFWALQAHAPDHGWQAIPGDAKDWFSMLVGESGEWWALYYTGLETRTNSAADMAARAQMLRSHFYAMQGNPVPTHAIPPPPLITSSSPGLWPREVILPSVVALWTMGLLLGPFHRSQTPAAKSVPRAIPRFGPTM